MDDPVFGFERPHRVGSICGMHCKQCRSKGKDNSRLYDTFGIVVPNTAMLIVAEATEDDWVRDVLARGGVPSNPDGSKYFYVVRPD